MGDSVHRFSSTLVSCFAVSYHSKEMFNDKFIYDFAMHCLSQSLGGEPCHYENIKWLFPFHHLSLNIGSLIIRENPVIMSINRLTVWLPTPLLLGRTLSIIMAVLWYCSGSWCSDCEL